MGLLTDQKLHFSSKLVVNLVVKVEIRLQRDHMLNSPLPEWLINSNNSTFRRGSVSSDDTSGDT